MKELRQTKKSSLMATDKDTSVCLGKEFQSLGNTTKRALYWVAICLSQKAGAPEAGCPKVTAVAV